MSALLHNVAFYLPFKFSFKICVQLIFYFSDHLYRISILIATNKFKQDKEHKRADILAADGTHGNYEEKQSNIK